MLMKLSIRDLDTSGKRVLMRVDFNVPLKEEADGTRVISDETRIEGALPSIRHLVENGAKLILMSHLGRPGGKRKLEYSLLPVADRLEEIFPGRVNFSDDCVGEEVAEKVRSLGEGEILLLENLRFHKEETANDPEFAAELGSYADIYVNDAFGTAHRAHASTVGVTDYVDFCAMGFLMERELQYLIEELEEPARPFVVILGGKKVSDKIGVIDALIEKADTILIGGAMQYAFRKAQGYEIGDSFCDSGDVPVAQSALDKAEDKGKQLVLPADCLEADAFADDANVSNIIPFAEGGGIAKGWEGLDIGRQAIVDFCRILKDARTVVWNGPMGVFELDSFAEGTRAIAEAVADSEAVSIIGGGDSVTAVKKFGFADRVTFISTGGGASLELLEGKELPGVSVLDDA